MAQQHWRGLAVCRERVTHGVSAEVCLLTSRPSEACRAELHLLDLSQTSLIMGNDQTGEKKKQKTIKLRGAVAEGVESLIPTRGPFLKKPAGPLHSPAPTGSRWTRGASVDCCLSLCVTLP